MPTTIIDTPSADGKTVTRVTTITTTQTFTAKQYKSLQPTATKNVQNAQDGLTKANTQKTMVDAIVAQLPKS